MQKIDVVLDSQLAENKLFVTKYDISQFGKINSEIQGSVETSPLEAWERVCFKLSQVLDKQIFTAWIKPLKFANIHNESAGNFSSFNTNKIIPQQVTLVAANKFCCEHVSKNYGSLISKLFSEELGVSTTEIAFIVDQDSVLISKNEQKTKSNGSFSSQGSIQNFSSKKKRPFDLSIRRQELSSGNINSRYNFSNFITGKSNELAYTVCKQVSQDLGGKYNPLFIYGGVGLGKTHLANAIGNYAKSDGKKSLLVSAESFLSELVSSLRNNSISQFKSKYRSLDLLVIDDVQFIIGKEKTQEEFFHTFNELHSRHKQIVITSDRLPQDLKDLDERLKNRFLSGIAVDLKKPDLETRISILKSKANLVNLTISDSVARILAERVDSNVRELEGVLNRLNAISSINGSIATEELAYDVVSSLVPNKVREITTDLVKRVVSEKFKINVSDIVGKRRTSNIAMARQIAMYMCREHTTCSYPEIGSLFGGRDHSTVIHAKKVVSEKLEKDECLSRLIKEITSQLFA
jgi:chromosomal replication initiator protein